MKDVALKWKKISKIVMLLVFVVRIFTLSSCSSTDKTATAGINMNYKVICAYNATEDTTSVKVPINVNNESIYNITKCSFKFDIYKDGELVRTTDYGDFDLSVSHSASKTTNLSFTAKGEVTDVKMLVDFNNDNSIKPFKLKNKDFIWIFGPSLFGRKSKEFQTKQIDFI